MIELLQWVGLGERMWVLPPVLSGGEKQRAAIARALIARPELLLADEPTGNVDPPLARRLLRLFVELNKSGTSVVIATHDLALDGPVRRAPAGAARRPAAHLRLTRRMRDRREPADRRELAAPPARADGVRRSAVRHRRSCRATPIAGARARVARRRHHDLSSPA